MTPKSYLSFIDGYKAIYKEKQSHIADMAKRMNTGLAKVIEATASVDELFKELVVKEKELAVANKKGGGRQFCCCREGEGVGASGEGSCASNRRLDCGGEGVR